MVNSKFWNDNFIVGLSPNEKYLFLYFLTNSHTELCGIYEIPFCVIRNETGLEEEEIQTALTALQEKIIYQDGWVYVKNFTKNQTPNENMKKGAERALIS